MVSPEETLVSLAQNKTMTPGGVWLAIRGSVPRTLNHGLQITYPTPPPNYLPSSEIMHNRPPNCRPSHPHFPDHESG